MPTVQEVIVTLTREAAETFERSIKAIPEDKLNWKPLEEGRSALDQLVECGAMGHMTARMIRDRAVPPFDPAEYAKMKEDYNSLEKAIPLLHSGVEDFVAAVQEFPEADLGETLYLPFVGGMTKSYLDIMYYPYWNMSYHLGQINYIQTLYGDKEMR